MNKISNLLLIIITLCYPFAVYFGLLHFDPRWIALLLIALLTLRLILTGKSHSLWVALIAMLALVWTAFNNQTIGLKLYPVIMSLGMLVLFAWSLYHPPTIIERIARKMEKDFPDEAIAYTRKVTWVWCLFFSCNACIALYTALWASMEIWTLYNGLISYLIMGCLFAGEWIIRQRTKRKHHAKSQ